MKILERRNIPKLSFGMLTVKFDSASVTSQVDSYIGEVELTSFIKLSLTNLAVVGVCQLQDGSMTMTSVVQYAFMVLLYSGGKGTRYSN